MMRYLAESIYHAPGMDTVGVIGCALPNRTFMVLLSLLGCQKAPQINNGKEVLDLLCGSSQEDVAAANLLTGG